VALLPLPLFFRFVVLVTVRLYDPLQTGSLTLNELFPYFLKMDFKFYLDSKQGSWLMRGSGDGKLRIMQQI
jgi:hypothetical protein